MQCTISYYLTPCPVFTTDIWMVGLPGVSGLANEPKRRLIIS